LGAVVQLHLGVVAVGGWLRAGGCWSRVVVEAVLVGVVW